MKGLFKETKKGGESVDDKQIIELYFERNEQAIKETEMNEGDREGHPYIITTAIKNRSYNGEKNCIYQAFSRQ